ncbi:MAG: hypothetical protein IPM93_17655 [Candidatus Obscuribacter sp.]|nr:hypothetical protein [Candidatus Obscuribacter sp.]
MTADTAVSEAKPALEDKPLNLTVPREALQEDLSRQSWQLMGDAQGAQGKSIWGGSEKLKDAGISFNKEEGKLKIDLQNKHDTWLQLGALSYHQNRQANYNETNYGVGILRRLDDESAVAFGYYRNSIHKDSFYAAYHYTPYQYGPVKLGLQAGLISGYKALKGFPTPMLLPLASIEGKNVAVDLTCIPPLGGVSAVCAAQMRVKF